MEAYVLTTAAISGLLWACINTPWCATQIGLGAAMTLVPNRAVAYMGVGLTGMALAACALELGPAPVLSEGLGVFTLTCGRLFQEAFRTIRENLTRQGTGTGTGTESDPCVWVGGRCIPKKLPESGTDDREKNCWERTLPGIPRIDISLSRFGQAARHIWYAQKVEGKRPILTIDRDPDRKTARRNAALRGYPTAFGPLVGLDRDEYPPAMFEEGGAGASVWYISARDNRAVGALLKAVRYPNRTRVELCVTP